MSTTTYFVLMNCDLVAVALPGDSAQGASVGPRYSGQLAARRSSEGRGQQVETADLGTNGALNGLATIEWRIALFDPLVDSLLGNAAGLRQVCHPAR
jgi:hypothetical protein